MVSGRPGAARDLTALLAAVSAFSVPWATVEASEYALLCGRSLDEAARLLEAFAESCVVETDDSFEVLLDASFYPEDGVVTGPGTPQVPAPLRLSERETRVLEEALDDWGMGRPSSVGGPLLDAYGSKGRAEHGPSPDTGAQEGSVSATNLLTLIDALLSRRRVVFSYLSYGDDTPRRRRVEPLDAFERGGLWYLFGLDVDKSASTGSDERRVFRLDRIAGVVETVGETCAHAPEEAPATVQGPRVRVALDDSRTLDTYRIWGDVRSRRRGKGAVLDVAATDNDWLPARLAACGGGARLSGDGEVVARVEDRTVAFIDALLAQAASD